MLLIDIIIPVYNKEKYIEELLRLLLSRQYLYDHIILVDDCSTDNSASIIRNYKGNYPNKIISFFQKKNMGPHYARIKGAELSDKKYVMFIDADDLINLSGLERFLHADLSWKNYGICYGKTLKIRRNNYILIKNNENDTNFKYKEVNLPIELLYKTAPTMSGIIIRKEIVYLMSIGKCDWGEDILFYVRAIMQVPFLFINVTLGIYRIVENSRGNSSGSFSKRWQFIKALNLILRKSQYFSISNFVFLFMVSSRTMLAWGIKHIKKFIDRS
jgi:glycosyltransferase involved in cell wall biosynthesis